MRELDPLGLPLSGTQLIEAGAGTGKTYNITLLYLRLLLERELDIEQILVVTFTEAAAAELRVRIRAKLLEMRDFLETGGGGDAVLAGLARRLDSPPAAAARLGDCLRRLDQASVFTIHGFCARVLAEHAFESGAPFETDYLTMEGPVLRSAAADFWRSRFYDLAPETARRLQKVCSDPDALARAVTPLLRLERPLLVPADSAADLRRREAQIKAALRRDELYRAALLREALDYIGCRFAEHKRERRLLSFDDLLQRVDAALQGDEGELLRSAVRARFPVALIDEFQDTDPVQYRIFRRTHGQSLDGGLILIGDPKQAIYGFRGADIYTYRHACADTRYPDAAHSLTVNWRSSSAYLQALNRLFSRDDAFVLDWIHYRPARPSGAGGPGLVVATEEMPAPMQVHLLPRSTANSNRRQRISAEKARSTAAAFCAREIARLLAASRQGIATLDGRPLRTGDLAILVRRGSEALQMRQALQSLGLSSVLQGRESVAASEEAEELARVLAAVVEPRSAPPLRAALSTRLLGADAVELEKLELDERRWSDCVARFEGYQAHWLRNGFAEMFRVLLNSEGVPRRLLGLADGERRLTDLLHLGELLQEMEREVFGIEAVLRRFAELRADPDGDSEAQQLRLESDEHLIRIVTIHKSKGLEYPIVFLPFPWFSRPVAKKPPYVFHDPHSGRASIYLGEGAKAASDRYRSLAERERLAEDLRLLYVAFTRAKHRCYFCWGRVEGASKSALAYLLHGGAADGAGDEGANGLDHLSDAEIAESVEKLFAGAAEIVALPDSETGAAAEVVPTAGAGPVPAVRVARKVARPPRQGWQSTSYSGLLAMSRRQSEGPDHDWTERSPAAADEPVSERTDIFSFPRGARAGELIHALLEDLDFTAAGGDVTTPLIRRHLLRAGYELRWAAVLESMLAEVLDTVLISAAGLRLRDIPNGRKAVELEFHYPLADTSIRELSDLLEQSGYSAPATDNGVPGLMNGVMHGFVDLVIEHRGRYYLLDYKSNHLGDELAAYAPDCLSRAVREHQYDLQYLVYVVALHRYLRYRLRHYHYERHFGGVLYLFVRGMRRDCGSTRGVHFARPEQSLVAELERLLCRGGDRE